MDSCRLKDFSNDCLKLSQIFLGFLNVSLSIRMICNHGGSSTRAGKRQQNSRLSPEGNRSKIANFIATFNFTA